MKSESICQRAKFISLASTNRLEFWSFHWLGVPLNFGKTIKGDEKCWFSLTNSWAWCRQNIWLISAFIFHSVVLTWRKHNHCWMLASHCKPSWSRVESTGPKIKNCRHESSNWKTIAFKKKELLSWKWRTQANLYLCFLIIALLLGTLYKISKQ